MKIESMGKQKEACGMVRGHVGTEMYIRDKCSTVEWSTVGYSTVGYSRVQNSRVQ